MNNGKTAKYAFRCTPKQREWLRELSFRLHEPLPVLLMVAALSLDLEVATPADYFRVKSKVLAKSSDVEDYDEIAKLG